MGVQRGARAVGAGGVEPRDEDVGAARARERTAAQVDADHR
jgi:hypothetical protein